MSIHQRTYGIYTPHSVKPQKPSNPKITHLTNRPSPFNLLHQLRPLHNLPPPLLRPRPNHLLIHNHQLEVAVRRGLRRSVLLWSVFLFGEGCHLLIELVRDPILVSPIHSRVTANHYKPKSYSKKKKEKTRYKNDNFILRQEKIKAELPLPAS
jgi:hypothetical protein